MSLNDGQRDKVHQPAMLFRRIAPALALGLLSPWVAEFLLGHIEIDGFPIIFYLGLLVLATRKVKHHVTQAARAGA